MSSAWPMPPAPDREYLASASDARLADDPLPPVPSVAAAPPPGRFVLLDDRGVYLREVPGPGGGPADPDAAVTLYVHGLAGSSTNFDSMATELAGYTRGFSVDLPGFGRSDPPPKEQYALIDDADLLAALLRRIAPGERAHVVGNSLGGVVSTALAARHPDLVRTLTLISPAVPDLRLTQDRGADPRLAVLLAPGTMPAAVRRLASIGPLARAQGMAALCYGDPSVLTDDDLAVAADDLGWRYSLPWVHSSTVQALRSLMRSYLRPGPWSFRAAAARVSVPTLVIWGAKDRLVDAKLAVPTAAAFADGRLLVLPGCGHVAMMEDPEATARATLALWQDAAGAPHSPAPTAVAPSSL